jgi:hypothetical protein
VRGLAWVNGVLYVADEPGNAIKAYDADGGFLAPAAPLQTPVHLLCREQALFVTARAGVFASPLSQSEPQKLAPELLIEGKDLSGMAFSPAGMFYVAHRKESKVSIFEDVAPHAEPKHVKTFAVLKEPEFVLYVPH